MTKIQQSLKSRLGIDGPEIHHNLSWSELFQATLKFDRGRIVGNGGYQDQKSYETKLKDNGPVVFLTDPDCTGRPVSDTYAVAWPEVESEIWWKDSLQKFDPDKYQQLLSRVISHLNQTRGRLFVQDVTVGQDPECSIPYRIIGQYAIHAMFARNMFITSKAEGDNRDTHENGWTMLNVQTFQCDPERDGCRSERVAVLDFRNRICLVAGRADYCGLVKKSIFTVMNYLLPKRGILSMHCSANIGTSNDSAILFGLSGTGKTTLSADPQRKLIGDDETCWTDNGISNLENGCYAKLINLDKVEEPVIASALSMKGTLIENVPNLDGVPYDQTDPQDLDLFDKSRTENTRFSYPLSCNPNLAEGGRGDHPATIVMLTADAFGVLPPISILDEDEAMYHFVQGFTARIAGTEVGLSEPEATFSSCFGAPFMAHKPMVYANLLKQKIRSSKARCVMLNTGWTGGPAGKSPRISISATRALLDAAMRGEFHNGSSGVEFAKHPILGVRHPTSCQGVDSSILEPRNCWSDKNAYDQATYRLREMFRSNFNKNQFGSAGIPEMI